MIDLHSITDPIALARAVLALPCTNEGEAMALGSHAHRLAEMLADAADEAKAADLHRNLNRRVAGALGLLEMQTDPETHEKYLPSWHDMPEKVEALKAERDAFEQAGRAAHEDADRVVEGARQSAMQWMHKCAVAVEALAEYRLTLAAEQGQQEGAPSKAWRYAQRHPSSELGWALPYPLDELPEEYRRPWAGRPTDHDPRCWALRRNGRWLLRWRAGHRKPSLHDSARAAMIAADKAIGQPAQPPDPRTSNHLLTLTPALLKRVEALGHIPGETPAGLLAWLVAYAEESRQDVVLAAGELLVPIPEPGSDLSRVMIANRLLKGRAEKAERELTEAQKTLSRWENEAAYLLDHTPGAIRVREGGGPENLRASLSVTWMKLLEAAKKYAEAVKSVEGVDLASVIANENPDRPGELREFNPTLAFQAIDLAKALVAERAKPRPWLITETEGSTCVAATSKETAWAAYEATIGGPVEFDDTEYHVHEVAVKHVDEMLEAALTADEELHKAKKAARVAEKDAEEKGKLLDEIRNVLGNGADERLWPPGLTLGEAVELLIERLSRPIDVVLHCPRCFTQHIDAPEPETGWTNPTHRSHACHACGLVFRHSDTPTNGVASATTRGQADSPSEDLTASIEDVSLEKVLRLDGEATDGPWEYDGSRCVYVPEHFRYPDSDSALFVGHRKPNAALIAYYRTAAPALARALIAERQKLNDATREAREEGIRVGQDTAAYQLEDLLSGRPLGDPAFTEPLIEALRKVSTLRGQCAEAIAELPEDVKRINVELRAENARLRKEIDSLIDSNARMMENGASESAHRQQAEEHATTMSLELTRVRTAILGEPEAPWRGIFGLALGFKGKVGDYARGALDVARRVFDGETIAGPDEAEKK